MRDCETCVHARPYGGEADNRCSAFGCDYINRDEAIEAYEIVIAMKATSEAYGRVRAVNVPKGTL